MEDTSQPTIIRESYVAGKNVLTVTTARAFLELCDVSYQKVHVPDLSPEEAYRKRLLQNTVEDMAFFFQQYLRLPRALNKDKKARYIDKKITGLLDEIEENLGEYESGLVQQLKSEEGTMLTAVVFILASVDCENPMSPFLNKVMAEFATCDDVRMPCFIDGLSHGSHPQVSNGIMLIREIAMESVKIACETILQNREHTGIGINRQSKTLIQK